MATSSRLGFLLLCVLMEGKVWWEVSQEPVMDSPSCPWREVAVGSSWDDLSSYDYQECPNEEYPDLNKGDR